MSNLRSSLFFVYLFCLYINVNTQCTSIYYDFFGVPYIESLSPTNSPDRIYATIDYETSYWDTEKGQRDVIIVVSTQTLEKPKDDDEKITLEHSPTSNSYSARMETNTNSSTFVL